MKKIFFILLLLAAMNLSAPAESTLYMRQRHLIENTSNINRRDVPVDEIIRQKIVMYARLEYLMMGILTAERRCALFYNSS
jgi:hypothetical protein